MKLSKNLSAFNCSMANELKNTFASNVEPFQMEDGMLVFRGPIEGHVDPKHIGTHVAVSLDDTVIKALITSFPAERTAMTEILLDNLGTQVKCQYDPKKVGPYSLDVVGTMDTIRG